MNVAAHTSASVHRCRDDVDGTSVMTFTHLEIALTVMYPAELACARVLRPACRAAGG